VIVISSSVSKNGLKLPILKVPAIKQIRVEESDPVVWARKERIPYDLRLVASRLTSGDAVGPATSLVAASRMLTSFEPPTSP
jgi:hypothetical protein